MITENWVIDCSKIRGCNADAYLIGGIFIATISSNFSKFNLGFTRRAKMH